MIFARRDALPDHVKVNKSGSISILSFVRHLGLPDDAEFSVKVIGTDQESQDTEFDGKVGLILTIQKPD